MEITSIVAVITILPILDPGGISKRLSGYEVINSEIHSLGRAESTAGELLSPAK